MEDATPLRNYTNKKYRGLRIWVTGRIPNRQYLISLAVQLIVAILVDSIILIYKIIYDISYFSYNIIVFLFLFFYFFIFIFIIIIIIIIILLFFYFTFLPFDFFIFIVFFFIFFFCPLLLSFLFYSAHWYLFGTPHPIALPYTRVSVPHRSNQTFMP